MEMKRISAGKLKAVGYDSRDRILRVELEDGSALEYIGVGDEAWRKLSTSGAAWSYYRDNIEEEYACRRANPRSSEAARAALDKLFGGE